LAKPKVQPGKLYAVEGVKELEIRKAGKQVLRQLSDKSAAGGVSSWDSSGLFHQLTQSTSDLVAPSPKTLLMLYAADLAFRLRWEIEPLRADGLNVVAAPYIETAIGFGLTAGIDENWLTELFRFAPKADATFRVPKADHGNSSGKGNGFVGYCFQLLAGASDYWKRAATGKPLAAHLRLLDPPPRARKKSAKKTRKR
jgi:hypothetical protein